MIEKQRLKISPGQYQFKPNAFLPWMNVRVFTQSITDKDKLCVRLAGVELDADKLIARGEWKPL